MALLAHGVEVAPVARCPALALVALATCPILRRLDGSLLGKDSRPVLEDLGPGATNPSLLVRLLQVRLKLRTSEVLPALGLRRESLLL